MTSISNSRVMPPAASVGTASPLCFSPPGRKADRSSPPPPAKMASSPQVLSRPADVMQNLSTFVQAAASPDQPRGCKQMVTQHLSHHVQQLCAVSGGTHVSSKHPTQTCLKNFFTAATARAPALNARGGGPTPQTTHAAGRTSAGNSPNLTNASLRSHPDCLSAPKKNLLLPPYTGTAGQSLDATTAVKNSSMEQPSLQSQKQDQPHAQPSVQQFHHQNVQQRQQEHRATQPQQRQGAQQHQHPAQQQQLSSLHKCQPPLQPQQERRRESLDREVPAVKAAGGPQACMRGHSQSHEKEVPKVKAPGASLAVSSATSLACQKSGSVALPSSPDVGAKRCADVGKTEKDDGRGEALLPFGSFLPIPGVPTAPENTLVILDYDDTLLPTNWAAVQNRVALTDPVPAELLQPLAELSDTAIQTIDVCLNTAMVVIVTNASVEWVNRSGEKFIPTVLNHIEKQGIQVISARDRLQNTGLPQKQWKIKVFEELINDVFGERMRDGSECSIVSIGDGEGEREACLEMCRNLGINEWLFKSLKLLSQPTCQQLASQHVLIQQAFLDILKVRQSLDMAILDYKNNVGGYPEDIPCVDDFSCSGNGRQMAALATGKGKGYPQQIQGVEATTTAETAAGAAEQRRKNGVTPVNSLPKASLSGFNDEFLFKGLLGDDNLKSQCRVHCPAAARRKAGYANYDVATFPDNTDAFVDLISNQLKAEHQPPASVSGSSPVTVRSGSLCAEEGDTTLVDNSRLLIA